VVPAHGSAVRRIASGCAEGAVEVARIEGQALALGWSLGELWSVTGWYHERGLVSLLRPGDRVLEVRRDRIRIDRANALGRVEQSFGRSRAAAAVAPEGWWQPRGNRPAGAVAEEAESVTC
jgi:hypothetical protein